MNSQFQPRSRLVSVHKVKGGCPVCGKPDNCAVSEDRRIAFCRRVESDKPGRGGWTHILTPNAPATRRTINLPPERPRREQAPIEHRDAIYSTLLRGHLTLSSDHRARLRARGFTNAEINRNGYASTPDERRAQEITDALSIYGLDGVPGFYLAGGRWRMVWTQGIFIPYRDAHGRIQALQYRPDTPPPKGGKYRWFSKSDACSSGTPPHYAYGHLFSEARELTVTEGGLKADLIAFFTGAPVVGLAGTSAFKDDFAALLKRDAPRARTIYLAFDRPDLYNPQKPQVFADLERLAAVLQRAMFRVRVRVWPGEEAKGFDDYLLFESRRAEVAA